MGLLARSRRKRKQAGFTLIELIIAITLVAAISAGLLMTFRTALLTLERTQVRLDQNRRAITTLDMIRRQIGGAMPVRSACRSADRMVTEDLFRGDQNMMLLVTNESLTEGSRGYPRIAEYRWAQNPNGTVRLEIREMLFSGPVSTAPVCQARGVMTPAPGQPVVLLDNLAFGRFAYREIDLGTGLGREWAAVWGRNRLPFAVRLELAPAAGSTTPMPVDSITIPLHMTKEAGADYDSAL